MSTATEVSVTKANLSKALLGSIVGGMIFGMLMSMMSMMNNVAMLVNSKSNAVGWVLHMAISMVFGLVYFAALRILPIEAPAAILGLIYGVGLWVVGFLFLMPAKLKMPLFHIDGMAMKSLMGHMIFGVVLGLIAGTRKTQTH